MAEMKTIPYPQTTKLITLLTILTTHTHIKTKMNNFQVLIGVNSWLVTLIPGL